MTFKFLGASHMKSIRKLAKAGDSQGLLALVLLEQTDSISDVVRAIDNLRSDLSFVKQIAEEQIENNRFLAHVRAQQIHLMMDEKEKQNDAT